MGKANQKHIINESLQDQIIETYQKSLSSYQSFSVVHYDKTVDLSHAVGHLISQHCVHLTDQSNDPLVLCIALTQLLVGNLAGVP